MAGVFIGPVEITNVGDIKIGTTDVTEIYVGATKIWPAGTPGLTPILDWNPESGEAIPGTSTFTRADVGFYRNDSGVWVEAASGELRFHNLTAGGGEKGYLPEPAATKLALFPRDFTNAVWTANNITPAKDATGIDNVVNAASTLTATAANGTILQSFTRSSSVHTFSVFVARKTGAGTIEITIDGGTTWVDITSSISSDIKDNPYLVTQTLANPSIGFRIVTSGDEIEVDMGDLEASDFATTPLDHTGSTATRAADSLTDSTTLPAAFSAIADTTAPFGDNSGGVNYGIIGTNVENENLIYLQSSGITRVRSFFIPALTLVNIAHEGERHKYAMSCQVGTNELITTDDEGGSDTDNVGADTWSGNTLRIGRIQTSNSEFRGVVHNVTVYSEPQTLAELQALIA